MVGNMGFSGLILIVIVALIFFGPSKLPQLGRAVGDTLREFRSSTKGVLDDAAEDAKADKASEQHKNKSVKLTPENKQGMHGVSIPDLKVNLNKAGSVEFVADKAGTFGYNCYVMCGFGHATMKGKRIVE